MSGSKTNLAQVWLHIYLFHAGTLFLWLYWPSFNSALASGNAQNRAIINTYYSMTGSVISTFIFSSVFDSHRKLNMVWDRLSVDLERKKYIKVVFFGMHTVTYSECDIGRGSGSGISRQHGDPTMGSTAHWISGWFRLCRWVSLLYRKFMLTV